MGGIFMFKFPTQDGVHYITQRQIPVAGTRVIMTYLIKGSAPVFAPVSGDPPACIHLYFQRQGDDMMAKKGTTEFYRWWSNPIAANLALGEITLIAPIKPDQWSSVLGKTGDKAPESFWDAWRNIQNIGMTFGAVNQFGHGVMLTSGSAKFILKKFQIL